VLGEGNRFVRDIQHIPTPLLLVAPRPDATAELRRRLATDAEGTARALVMHRLATYALARLPELGLDPSPIGKALGPASLVELGWTAKRKLALQELDDQCQDGHPRLLFKGAATSRLYYPQETWRWSGDIDVMMRETDLDRLHPEAMADLRARHEEIPFPEHHIERQVMAGTAVELHYRLEFSPIWGTLPDLLPGATPCPEFPSLLVPATGISFTLALLHLLKHRASMPFDVLDLARMEATGLDWETLAEGWRQAGISPYTIAALSAAHELAGVGPPETIDALWQRLGPSGARLAGFLRRCVLAPRLSRLGKYRFECAFMGIPFGRFCLRTFLGTRAATRRLTGWSTRDPRFWLAHCLGLPARRLWRLLRGASGI
jgi:hypothetical protein